MSDKPDKLEEIFALQASLNDAIFVKQGIKDDTYEMGGFPLSMARIGGAAREGRLGPNDLPNIWLRKYLHAILAEAEELEDSLLWKWWSKDKIDLQNSRVEIVDMMHFLTSLALASGMSADEFFTLYTAKHRVNENRQENNYSAFTKTEDDNKALMV